MYGRGRGHQLLNSATNGEVNNSFRNEGATTSETTSEIVTIPSITWRRELSPARPVSEDVQRLTEMSFRRMEEAMEEQRNARRHQMNIPDTPRSPSPVSMEEQENYVQPPRIIPMAPGNDNCLHRTIHCTDPLQHAACPTFCKSISRCNAS
jgi:hypothetical protein